MFRLLSLTLSCLRQFRVLARNIEKKQVTACNLFNDVDRTILLGVCCCLWFSLFCTSTFYVNLSNCFQCPIAFWRGYSETTKMIKKHCKGFKLWLLNDWLHLTYDVNNWVRLKRQLNGSGFMHCMSASHNRIDKMNLPNADKGGFPLVEFFDRSNILRLLQCRNYESFHHHFL